MSECFSVTRQWWLILVLTIIVPLAACSVADDSMDNALGQPRSGTPKVADSSFQDSLAIVLPSVTCDSLMDVDITSIGGQGSKITAVNTGVNSGTPVCVVSGMLAPTIGFQVLLPTKTWAQRYLQTGCGGLCGNLSIRVGAADGCEPVADGRFVMASTDMGHQGFGGEFGRDAQKRIDFAYRSVHLTAVTAKLLIKTFYGQPEKYAYFSGCSDGGREGLVEAQRFPNDFDGIVAGAPAMNFSVQNSFFHAWQALSNTDADGKPILTAERLPILHEAVIAKCDSIDGLEDGLITDPRACDFDPSSLVCEDDDDKEACLTAQEAGVATKFYRGPRDPLSGKALTIAGPMYGSELSWAGVYVPLAGSDVIFSSMIARDSIANLIYEVNPNEDFALNDFVFTEENFERIRPLNSLYSSTNPDLTVFNANGGKLILWHGWSDPHISPINTIAYFEALENVMGKDVLGNLAKLYLFPGMYHCAGGNGPSQFDLLTPLMNWVERGVVPNRIVAVQSSEKSRKPVAGAPSGSEHSVVGGALDIVRSRPVYPYPEIAVYSGSGSVYKADNFSAKMGTTHSGNYDWAGADFYRPHN